MGSLNKHVNRVKFSQIIIVVLLLMTLNTGCSTDSIPLKKGVFVGLESVENNFSLRNYGYLFVNKDTIVLNSYGFSNSLKIDKRRFVRKKGSTYLNSVDNEMIVAKLVNDTLMEIEFEDDFNHKYTRINDHERSVDFDFSQKQFRYQIDNSIYLMQFYSDNTAIGINEVNKESVKYRWSKIKLANQWFLILSNNLYSYHLKIDSVIEENVMLTTFLESPKKLEFRKVDVDMSDNVIK
mgnify:CR=1 FL=1